MWEELGSGLTEATAVKVAELVALFPQHVRGAGKWAGKEATAMNCQSRL